MQQERLSMWRGASVRGYTSRMRFAIGELLPARDSLRPAAGLKQRFPQLVPTPLQGVDLLGVKHAISQSPV
jgi:hypothetical protein